MDTNLRAAYEANGNQPVISTIYLSKNTDSTNVSYGVAYDNGNSYTKTAYTLSEYATAKDTARGAASEQPIFSLFNGVPGDVYAIRVYNCALTAAEKEQKRFADLAAYLALPLSCYAQLSADAQTTVRAYAVEEYDYLTVPEVAQTDFDSLCMTMIGAAVVAQDEANAHLSHPIRKAMAFDLVLKNTRISCDPRDIFPNINAMDRPLETPLCGKWRREVFNEIIPDVGKRRVTLEKEGVATMWPDFAHSVPDWERIFTLGFKGLKEDAARARNALAEKRALTAKEEAFFLAIDMTYKSILCFVGRLAELAALTHGSERMAKALANIKEAPPTTFYEVLLVDYLYFIICEHIQGMQVRSLSNFDRVLFPYYENDLKNGVTQEEIRRDLACFLLQFTAIGNYSMSLMLTRSGTPRPIRKSTRTCRSACAAGTCFGTILKKKSRMALSVRQKVWFDSMKKILLIGDSIRAGYDKYVKMSLKDVAEVGYPGENCRFTTYILRNLKAWVDQAFPTGGVDLVHFNVGLWDDLRMEDGEVLVSIEEYERNLNRIFGLIKRYCPGAKIVFATSTPVREELFRELKRYNRDTEAYNAVGARLAEKHGAAVNDLYALMKAQPVEFHSDMTHYYTKDGTRVITNQVLSCLEEQLGIKGEPLDFDALFDEKKDIVGI